MALSTYEDFMLPLLKAIDDGGVHRLRDLYEPLARSFSVTPKRSYEVLDISEDFFDEVE
jgi:restriction endonuclease Mrr